MKNQHKIHFGTTFIAFDQDYCEFNIHDQLCGTIYTPC